MSSSLIRQDVLPVGVGYLLVMGALGTGLWLIRRQHGDAPAANSEPDREADVAPRSRYREAGAAAGTGTADPRPDWLRLARYYAGTAIGGYLLLMAVVIGYYYGVARVGGAFIVSAFTGCALLIALSTPVYAVASWVTVGRRDRAPRRHNQAAAPTSPTDPS
jgi:Family of unknown function (DUF6256)